MRHVGKRSRTIFDLLQRQDDGSVFDSDDDSLNEEVELESKNDDVVCNNEGDQLLQVDAAQKLPPSTEPEPETETETATIPPVVCKESVNAVLSGAEQEKPQKEGPKVKAPVVIRDPAFVVSPAPAPKNQVRDALTPTRPVRRDWQPPREENRDRGLGRGPVRELASNRDRTRHPGTERPPPQGGDRELHRDSRAVGNGVRVFPPCSICSQTRHEESRCPQRGRNCYQCGEAGHVSSGCPRRRCYICHSTGHAPALCPRSSSAAPVSTPPAPTVARPTPPTGPVCTVCALRDHRTQVCPQRNKECFQCGAVGHVSGACHLHKKTRSPEIPRVLQSSSRFPHSRRSPSPRSSRGRPIERSPSPRSSRGRPIERSPSPRSSRSRPIERSPSPRSSRGRLIERSPSPRSSRGRPIERSPSPRGRPLERSRFSRRSRSRSRHRSRSRSFTRAGSTDRVYRNMPRRDRNLSFERDRSPERWLDRDYELGRGFVERRYELESRYGSGGGGSSRTEERICESSFYRTGTGKRPIRELNSSLRPERAERSGERDRVLHSQDRRRSLSSTALPTSRYERAPAILSSKPSSAVPDEPATKRRIMNVRGRRLHS